MSEPGFREGLADEAKSLAFSLGSILVDTAFLVVWLAGTWFVGYVANQLGLSVTPSTEFTTIQWILSAGGIIIMIIHSGETILITLARAIIKVRDEWKKIWISESLKVEQKLVKQPVISQVPVSARISLAQANAVKDKNDISETTVDQ